MSPLLVVVTNLGSISYMVKGKNFDYSKGVRLLNEMIQRYNQASDLKGYQDAAKFFLNHCYQAGIIYEDR